MNLNALTLSSRRWVAYAFRAVAALYAVDVIHGVTVAPIPWEVLLFDACLVYLLVYSAGLALALDRAEHELRVTLALGLPRPAHPLLRPRR